MMIKLIITYQASSSSSHCAAQSPKLTRVTGSSPCFNTCEYFLNPLLLLLYSLHRPPPVPPWSNQSILANSFLIFSLFFFLFIIIHLFHQAQTKNIFFSSSTLVSPPRQQRRPFCECFRSGFCFWSLSSLDEVAPHSGWCAY